MRSTLFGSSGAMILFAKGITPALVPEGQNRNKRFRVFCIIDTLLKAENQNSLIKPMLFGSSGAGIIFLLEFYFFLAPPEP